ncbi:DNA mismatch repair endonuclease MutL [Candidatus Palibaumannia cicadellinicola]|uniref:DNA mismatch repair protein MutL n=1 Tax=Candidatus Palibaumannia cicadellinicola TaxID=186490 RepID=A0A0K2BLP6_9GAMM|nr:DNA mismatch repair endonuclease MutL [Candidatus Baumannia cicadellinicola]AKZ66109.1 DNA mismatch repair protein [Candidatus Baumannia cicadellinicola]
MPIIILSKQLVNQISAGEIVERPASVVKELVENSLDAGATHIDINIENGGMKTIRIRDNGSGISKNELILALARHATSKISTIEDLESITSMGFRGEALASISSVARITITSRITEQNEAWQASAEAYKDNIASISIKPAAHPVGTTVEVQDLFYNTPARRKFMRTDKTEFKNIEEVIRIIALARFDVTFIVQHNNKNVQLYRAVRDNSQYLRRLSSICGIRFVKRALVLCWQYSDITVSGWTEDSDKPEKNEYFPIIKYSYVNQRVIRNKLINHAISQAYQEQLNGIRSPAFVMFITMNPNQIDINVHPAKKDVRFHNERLVHHVIYQAVVTVLQKKIKPYLDTTNYIPIPLCSNKLQAVTEPDKANELVSNSTRVIIYNKQHKNNICTKEKNINTAANISSDYKNSFGRLLTVYYPCYALLEAAHGLSLLSLKFANIYITERQLTPEKDNIISHSLLIPIRMTLSKDETVTLYKNIVFLKNIGIVLQANESQVILNAVPLPLLRKKNLHNLIIELLVYLNSEYLITSKKIAAWLARNINNETTTIWSYYRAIPLIAEIERLCPHWVNNPPNSLIVKLNVEAAIKKLNYE